jgi:hypothetical protein
MGMGMGMAKSTGMGMAKSTQGMSESVDGILSQNQVDSLQLPQLGLVVSFVPDPMADKLSGTYEATVLSQKPIAISLGSRDRDRSHTNG